MQSVLTEKKLSQKDTKKRAKQLISLKLKTPEYRKIKKEQWDYLLNSKLHA